jgi:hypothetical protein
LVGDARIVPCISGKLEERVVEARRLGREGQMNKLKLLVSPPGSGDRTVNVAAADHLESNSQGTLPTGRSWYLIE